MLLNTNELDFYKSKIDFNLIVVCFNKLHFKGMYRIKLYLKAILYICESLL